MITMLPSNFVSKMSKLENYSKAPIRIVPQSQGIVKPNQIIKFTFPSGVVLDMKTFCIHFDFVTKLNNANTTDAKLVGMPRFTSSLIDTLEVWVNGRPAQNTPYYNRIYHIFQNFKHNYNSQVKRMTDNCDPSVYSTLGANGAIANFTTKYGTGAAATNNFNGRYTISDFVGFLDCKPNILDLNLIGSLELVLKMAPPTVLFGAGLVGADSVDYEVNNVVAYADQIYFKDELYYNELRARMANDGFKIIYNNYSVYTGSAIADTTGSKTNTVKCTESCENLDMLIYTMFDTTSTGKQDLVLGDAASATTSAELLAGRLPASHYNFNNVLKAGNTSLLNSSVYFRSNGVGVSTLQWQINSQDITIPMNITEQWEETKKALDLCHNPDKQINPAIRSIPIYQKDFYVSALSTSHIGNEDPTLAELFSGRNTMSTSLNISAICQGGNWDAAQAGCQPAIITCYKSRLHVTGERNILPVK